MSAATAVSKLSVDDTVRLETSIGRAVAMLHVLSNHQPAETGTDLDGFIAGGLGSLADQVSLDLVAAFNQLGGK
jgi:hypothetical protein